MRKTGHYEQLGTIEYFIPNALPPHNPPLQLDIETMVLYGDAMLHLGKLNEMAENLPDKERFIKAYIIKEALLSSSIEGIHTTLLDVFTQPILETKPNKETQLVMNYTKALHKALSLTQEENIPLISSRVILSAHKTLMQTGHGEKSNPGNYRKQSVRVGNLVPPPPHLIAELIAQLEQYSNIINTDSELPPLIRAGLVHVQFETIHPFLDGNGRIGRLLIVLMLIENGLLSEPILYPSYYFKKHQLEYYQWLDRVRTHGDFEGWITFYLTALKESSIDAYKRAKDIETLRQDLIQRITNEKRFSISVKEKRLTTLSLLFSYPVISISILSLYLKVSYNTAHRIIADFINLGLLSEENNQARGKLFIFKHYLDILEQEYN